MEWLCDSSKSEILSKHYQQTNVFLTLIEIFSKTHLFKLLTKLFLKRNFLLTYPQITNFLMTYNILENKHHYLTKYIPLFIVGSMISMVLQLKLQTYKEHGHSMERLADVPACLTLTNNMMIFLIHFLFLSFLIELLVLT